MRALLLQALDTASAAPCCRLRIVSIEVYEREADMQLLQASNTASAATSSSAHTYLPLRNVRCYAWGPTSMPVWERACTCCCCRLRISHSLRPGRNEAHHAGESHVVKRVVKRLAPSGTCEYDAVAGFEYRIRCDPDEKKLNMQEKALSY